MPIVIDVETTGLPTSRGFGKGFADFRHLPAYDRARVVQASWLVCDDGLAVLKTRDFLVRPDGFVVHEDSTRIHGISHERAVAEGVPIGDVLDALHADLLGGGALVAHNADFDTNVLKSEMHRAGRADCLAAFSEAPVVCTMLATVDACRLEFKGGPWLGGPRYKFPKQSELYERFVGGEMSGAHNSLHDVTNLLEILRRMPGLLA